MPAAGHRAAGHRDQGVLEVQETVPEGLVLVWVSGIQYLPLKQY